MSKYFALLRIIEDADIVIYSKKNIFHTNNVNFIRITYLKKICDSLINFLYRYLFIFFIEMIRYGTK